MFTALTIFAIGHNYRHPISLPREGAMNDPGSAVGVLSLGVQVAQGLVKYYSSFKAYDVDIARAIEHVERLYSTLAALEAPLSRFELSNDSVPERVRISLNSCRQELSNLEDLVKKCAEVSVPHSISTRIQRVKPRRCIRFEKVRCWIWRSVCIKHR
jgi:hypothetical protein